MEARLFDPGEPIVAVAATEAEVCREQEHAADEQLEFPWQTVRPLYPLESEWIHEPTCLCGACRDERCRLLEFRREQLAQRCEADRLAIEDRVELYRRRAELGLPLFDVLDND